MNKYKLFLAISVISLLLMGVAVFNPFSGKSSSTIEAASDFHQRHPDWVWTVNRQNALIPLTGVGAFPDYFQRHPELTMPSVTGIGASDYFQRHPELVAPAEIRVDLTDYYFRQQVLKRTGSDPTDYYFRHLDN